MLFESFCFLTDWRNEEKDFISNSVYVGDYLRITDNDDEAYAEMKEGCVDIFSLQ